MSETVNRCSFCDEEVTYPHRCNLCGHYFCPKHRLPENHECIGLLSYPAWRERYVLSERQKKKIEREPSPMEYLEKLQSYSSKNTTDTQPKKRRLPKIGQNKLVITSIVILVFLLIEYLFFTTYFHPTIYILVALGTIYLDYKLFVRASKIRIHSDLRLFGMRILSGITLLVGIMFIIGIFFLPIFYPTQLSYENPVYICLIIFFGIFGLGLILLSSFLMLRFMRRAGIIVYRR